MTDPQTFPEALDAERTTRQVPPASISGPQTEGQSEQPMRQASPPPADASGGVWSARCAAAARLAQRVLSRPKVKLTVLGGALLLLAAFVVTGSAWTAPLAVVGIVVLIVAWFGSRLDGRLVLEWGRSGATFEFKADINAPEHPRQHVESLAIARGRVPASHEALVVEGAAPTVEIDIDELKSLIALAEAARLRERSDLEMLSRWRACGRIS